MTSTMSSSSGRREQKIGSAFDVPAILKEVPEARLRIFDIAKKAVKPDGSIDIDGLVENMKEIRQAANEAESYAQDTIDAVYLLKRLGKGE